jgi:hypothetical protein
MRRIPVWINPLDLFPLGDQAPTADETLAAMFTPGEPFESSSVQARYRAITSSHPPLFAPPAEGRILNQLIWPLRHAKACYVVGNYLATIALAGIVAEMTAILIHDLMDRLFNNRAMTPEDEAQIYGRSFEELDQRRRIEVLRGYGALTAEAFEAFGRLRGTRKKHLHLAQLVDEKELSRDARAMFRDAVLVVAACIGQNMNDGKLVLTPQMMRYLERVGTVPPSVGPEGEEGGDNG